MPKQADIRVQVPCCTATHFWNVVYERPEATERYHTSFNASTATGVTPWVSCQRTVNFTMPLKLPDFVKRVVGLDSVAVTEVQRVVWHGSGAFTVSSETNISNMMGAGRFATTLQLTVTEQPQAPGPGLPDDAPPPDSAAAVSPAGAGGGAQAKAARDSPIPAAGPGPGPGSGDCSSSVVQLVYGVRCAAASIPWPMAATIENVMSEKALPRPSPAPSLPRPIPPPPRPSPLAPATQISMQSFLDFCTQLLAEADERQEEEKQAAAATNAAAGVAAAAAGDLASGAAVRASAAGDDVTGASAASGALQAPVAAVRLSDNGSVVAGGPWIAGASVGLSTRASTRHRWPSITCSQEIGGGVGAGVGAGAAGVDTFQRLQRQDALGTQGGGDMFWDAPETFGGGSGVSSGAVSPRQLPLQSGSSLRRLSTDTSVALAATATSTAGGGGAAIPFAPSAVAMDRLSAAVAAAMDAKLDRLQKLQEQRWQQLLQQLQDLQLQNQQLLVHQQQLQQQLQAQSDYLLGERRRRRQGGGSDGGSDSSVSSSGAGERGRSSDLRWMLRVTAAVLLATLLLLAYWMLHPHAGGFRPGAGSGGGRSTAPLVSVPRLEGGGGAAAAVGGRLRSGGGGVELRDGGAMGGADATEGRSRLTLQALGRRGGRGWPRRRRWWQRR